MAFSDLSQHEVSAACLSVPQLRDHCTYMGRHAIFTNSNAIQCSPRMMCGEKWLESHCTGLSALGCKTDMESLLPLASGGCFLI